MATETKVPVRVGERPTQVRYLVILFAVALAVITYIDRVCISQAAPAMTRELGLNKVEMGYAFAAFGWAYAIFEIPGGFLGPGIQPVVLSVGNASSQSGVTIAIR